MNYVGDYTAGDTVFIPFNTFDSNDPSASVTMTNFVNTDVHIHNALNLTQRNNAAGVTVDVDVDGITGCHGITIDTADNTVADFFVSGADYGVRIEGVTVDAATLNPWVGHFSIENRHVAGSMVRTTIATLASQTSFTLTKGSADDDAYNNCTVVVTDIASAIQKAIGRISDYTGSSKTVTLGADPGIFTMAASDRIHIIASSALANVDAVGGTLQTAGDIPALLTTVDTVVDGIQTDLDNGTDGLGAIKTETAAIVNDTDLIDDGTSGLAKIATDVAAVLVDTAVIGAAGAGLTDLGGMSTGMKGEVNTEADTALTDYNGPTSAELVTEINSVQTDIAALNDLSAAQVNTEADTALSDYDPPTKAEMDTAHALLATEAKQDILDTNVDDIEADLANGTDGLGALKTLIDALNDLSAAQVNTEVDNALNTAIPGSPTANSINEVLQRLGRSADMIQEYTIDNGSFTATTTAAQVDAVSHGTLEATDDHFNGRILFFTSGANIYQATDITDYDGTNKRFTYTAVTDTPADNDTFILI